MRRLADVLAELSKIGTTLEGAAGAHLVDLVALTAAEIVEE